MVRPPNSSEESEEENLTQAFSSAAINATYRRSSTTNDHEDNLQTDNEQSHEEEEEPSVAESVNAPEPANPTNNNRLRRRKPLTPSSRKQRLDREIRKLQLCPHFLIPRLSFGRVVREIMGRHADPPMRITIGALEALQTATEMYITQRLEDAYLMTMHRGRVTLEVRDLALMTYICSKIGQL